MPYASNANNLQLRLGDLSGKPIPKVAASDPDQDSMLDMIER
jgi:hypothetical protein